MLYFRFDCRKEDFKGAEHKSVAYGHSVDDVVDSLFEEESELLNGYYLDTYRRLKQKFWDLEEITEQEYDKEIKALKEEYIKDELTLNGCSCFELSDEGIEFSNSYKYDDREIITIFEGEEVAIGHDGEIIAKCEKIVWQGNSEEMTNIFYDDDIEDKVAEVLKIIK